MEVINGSSYHTTKTEPETDKLKLKDESSPSTNNIPIYMLQYQPLPYTAISVVVAAKVIASKVNKLKPEF